MGHRDLVEDAEQGAQAVAGREDCARALNLESARASDGNTCGVQGQLDESAAAKQSVILVMHQLLALPEPMPSWLDLRQASLLRVQTAFSGPRTYELLRCSVAIEGCMGTRCFQLQLLSDAGVAA